MTTPAPGSIGWIDLTVPDAPSVRDFYAEVVGWQPAPVEMQGYEDWMMAPPGGDPVAGVCNARGVNAGLPAVWLIYITVADLDASLAACVARGGEVLAEPRGTGWRYAVIKDPAGAVCALIQVASQ